MSALSSRRGFLRGLTTLPLIGGGVVLTRAPSAVAIEPTPRLMANYATWLGSEERILRWELSKLIGIPYAELSRWAMVDGDFHWPIGKPWYEVPMPSTRAALVLSTVGAPDGPSALRVPHTRVTNPARPLARPLFSSGTLASEPSRASRQPVAQSRAGGNLVPGRNDVREGTMSKLITVDFHDDTLFAVEAPDGVFVAIKPICDALGIEWRKQHERLKRDPILSEGITMTGIPSPGGAQETTVLRLDLLQGWLFGIDASRVKAEARDRVLAYKRECFAVLYAHFYAPRSPLPTVPVSPSPAEPIPHYVKRSLVNEARMTFGGAAARELWRELGLPVTPAMKPGSPQGALELEGGH